MLWWSSLKLYPEQTRPKITCYCFGFFFWAEKPRIFHWCPVESPSLFVFRFSLLARLISSSVEFTLRSFF